jgi:hypothetical protein
METPKKLRQGWLIIAIPILVVICILIAVRVVNSMDHHQNGIDFFNFWLAGHLVTQGQSPYDTAQWIAGYPPYELDIILNPAFLYPLPLALLFAPLGWLSFHNAYIIWVTLLQLMIVVSLAVLIIIASNPRSKLFFIPLLAGIVLFRSTTLTLTQGQVSALFLFVMAIMALLWGQGKWFWGGFLLGLLVLKPNLGVIVIALLTLWLLIRKRWTALAGAAVSGFLLLIAGLIYNPHWIVEYWAIGSNKLAQTFGGSPTVWGLSALVCRSNATCVLAFGGAAVLLLVLGFLWLIVSHKGLAPATILALAVTTTLLVAPYTWTYDQLLLIIPITLVTLAMDRLGFGLLFSAGVFPAIDALVVILLIFDVALQVEILNAFLPLVVLGLGAWFLTRPAQ